jgi:hypothetical protein
LAGLDFMGAAYGIKGDTTAGVNYRRSVGSSSLRITKAAAGVKILEIVP